MRVLVTTSRMPVAVDLIYKLGHAGAEVFAADTFEQAPGGHSSCVRKSFVVPSPRFETAAFVREINRICEKHDIDTILPCFEEAFHLRWNRSALPSAVLLLTASTETLQRLHSKSPSQHSPESSG